MLTLLLVDNALFLYATPISFDEEKKTKQQMKQLLVEANSTMDLYSH